MGRKLTSYEKSQRESDRDYERESSRRATEWRREEARRSKEKELNESYEESSRLVEEWKEFYHSVTNLQVAASHYIGKHNSIFEWISEVCPKKVPPFTRKVKIVPQTEFSEKTFVPHPAFKQFKKEVAYTLRDYCRIFNKTYIPILDLLVGTKRGYDSFIESRTGLIVADEKRKEEYLKLVKQFEEKEKPHLLKLEEEELQIKNRYESFAKEVKMRIEVTEKTIAQIRNEFDDTTKNVFYQVLLSKLPLQVEVPKHKFLKRDIGYFLQGERKYRVGIGLAKPDTDFLNVYVCIPNDHFPLEDKQLVLLKETHSERPLTKQQHQEVETSFYESLAISYAHYFLRFTKRNNVNVHLMVDGLDPSTGQGAKLLYKGYQFDRKPFELLVLDKLVASEAIKKFPAIHSLVEDSIMWSYIKKSETYPIEISKELFNFLHADPVNTPKEFSEIGSIGFAKQKELIKLREKLFELQTSSLQVYVESEWLINLRKVNPELADQYADWDKQMTKSLETQKKILSKSGIDTSHIDSFAKKSGRKLNR